jgi:serine/threonine protein kinase
LDGQLCGGAAFIEQQGYAHGDLRPDNLLLDQNGNLRIQDFGAPLSIGRRLPVGTEPFARLLSKEDGKSRGYGLAGAYSENFAIGSIFYSLTRGHYPYALEGHDVQTLMGMFQQKEFPQLTGSTEDGVISMCWYGKYQSVTELEQVFRDIAG